MTSHFLITALLLAVEPTITLTYNPNETWIMKAASNKYTVPDQIKSKPAQVGDVYSYLTLKQEVGGYPRKFLCECCCGNRVITRLGHLRNGHTKSCGRCLIPEKQHGTTHGMSNSSEYKIWRGMISRCSNPKTKCYKDYGGRGITVCNEWNSFENFLKDMGNRPNGLTLHRVNNDRGYSADNCVWATDAVQNRHTTRITIGYALAKHLKELRASGMSFAAMARIVNRNVHTVYSLFRINPAKRTWSDA